MEPAKNLVEQFEESLKELEKDKETSKIIDITELNGSSKPEIEEDNEPDPYEGLNELLKKATMIIRTYGAVYAISFLLSSWVANRMFQFAVWNQSKNNWDHPVTDLCIFFTSALIGYVLVSFFWKYLFVNIANIDDAITIKKIYKLIWSRAMYPIILGIFDFYIWNALIGVDGGRNFAVFVTMIFGAQILFFVLCEVFLQKVYKQLKKY